MTTEKSFRYQCLQNYTTKKIILITGEANARIEFPISGKTVFFKKEAKNISRQDLSKEWGIKIEEVKEQTSLKGLPETDIPIIVTKKIAKFIHTAGIQYSSLIVYPAVLKDEGNSLIIKRFCTYQ